VSRKQARLRTRSEASWSSRALKATGKPFVWRSVTRNRNTISVPSIRCAALTKGIGGITPGMKLKLAA